jgi:glycosyltransferase involved in cell wall biosynthesis
MARLAPETSFVCYTDRPDSHGVFGDLPNCVVRILTPKIYPIWEQVALPRVLKEDGIEIFHALGNTAPLKMPQGIRLAVTLHDVMFMKPASELPASSSLYQRIGRIYRRSVAPRVAAQADVIFTVSSYSRNDICNTFPMISPSKVVVTYQGLPAHFQNLPATPGPHPFQDRPFLLHLGGFDPRKNTRRVIQAYLNLVQHGLINAHLLILGLRNLNGLGLTPREKEVAKTWVHLPGFVSESVLPDYYRHAQALLFPSLYEGFGIPLLEAMSSGTPILTSRVTSLPEIAGEAALLVDPASISSLEEGIHRLIGSVDLRTSLSRLGQDRLTLYNWDNTASQTIDAYRAMMAFPRPAAPGC